MDFLDRAADWYEQQSLSLAAKATVMYMEHSDVIDPGVDAVRAALPYVHLLHKMFEGAENSLGDIELPASTEILEHTVGVIDESKLPEVSEQWEQAEYANELDESLNSADLSPDLSGTQVEKDIAQMQALREVQQAQLAEKQQEHTLARQVQERAIADQAEKLARAYDGDALAGFQDQLNDAAKTAQDDMAKQQNKEMQEMAARHEAELTRLTEKQEAGVELDREAEAMTREAPPPPTF